MNSLPSAFDGSLELYFNVVREGVAVHSHYDLLKWLQGDVQHYLPHKITPLARQREVVFPPTDLTQSRKKYGLSMRETEILDWVRLGKTNPEIATILEISVCTVKNHLQAIFRKLDVYNRVQAIAKIGSAPVIAHPVPSLSPAAAPLRACPVNIPPVCRAIKQLF